MRSPFTFVVFLGSAVLTASAAVSPITISGYNHDIVVEKGAPSNASGVVDTTMDGGFAIPTGGTWYEAGFNAAAPTTGLPVAGSTITSLLAADHTYKFPLSYGPGNGAAGITNNAFVVGQSSGTAIITLATPAPYSLLSLIGSAGHGPVSVSYTFLHADSTTETGIFAAGDWFNGTAAYNSNGRLTVNTGAFDNVNAGNPRLYTFDFNLTNQSPVTSITLNSTSTTGTAAFFALSGTAIPEPSSALLALAATGLLAARRRKTDR